MLSKEEFSSFGDEAILFLHVTSRFEGEPYPDLFTEKGGTGFPHFVVMDATGDVIATHEGTRSLDGFRETVHAAEAYVDLREKAATGGPELKTQLLIATIKLGKLDFDAATDERKKLTKVTDEQDAELDKLMLGLEFRSLRATLRGRDDLPKVGEKLLAMKAEGRIPEGTDGVDFWWLLSFYAEEKEDAKLFREVWETLKDNALLPDRAKQSLEERLNKLEGKGG